MNRQTNIMGSGNFFCLHFEFEKNNNNKNKNKFFLALLVFLKAST
jgi:hypothetical protein